MICQRSGYCCVQSDVIIVDPVHLALRHKPNGVRCPHLERQDNGLESCKVHSEWWYPATPCYSHGQIERSHEEPCRMGHAIFSGELSVLKTHLANAPAVEMSMLDIRCQWDTQEEMDEILRRDLAYKLSSD